MVLKNKNMQYNKYYNSFTFHILNVMNQNNVQNEKYLQIILILQYLIITGSITNLIINTMTAMRQKAVTEYILSKYVLHVIPNSLIVPIYFFFIIKSLIDIILVW